MKKQLLKESEVRKLMKFANIGALTNGFVSRIAEADMMEPEEEEGEMDDTPAIAGADPNVGADPDLGDMPDEVTKADPAPEAAGDEAMAPEGDLPELVGDLVTTLDAVLTAANPELAGMVTSQRGDEPDMADAGPMGDEGVEAGPEMDPMDLGGDEAGLGDEAEDEAELDTPEDGPVTEDLVNEVARRVARRLRKLRSR